jgi:hypothetical protein
VIGVAADGGAEPALNRHEVRGTSRIEQRASFSRAVGGRKDPDRPPDYARTRRWRWAKRPRRSAQRLRHSSRKVPDAKGIDDYPHLSACGDALRSGGNLLQIGVSGTRSSAERGHRTQEVADRWRTAAKPAGARHSSSSPSPPQWDFEAAAESQTRAKPSRTKALGARPSAPPMRRFAGLSSRSWEPRDSLNIVVSPVRVRVSPSQELPANGPLLVATSRHDTSDYAPRADVKSQNEVPMDPGL